MYTAPCSPVTKQTDSCRFAEALARNNVRAQLRAVYKKALFWTKPGFRKTYILLRILDLKQIVGVNMEISLTKLSPNGQVVIPAEIRKEAGLKASTKFLVYNQGGNILLKQVRAESLKKDMELLEKIRRSEEQITQGKVIRTNTSMSDEEIDDLLMN